MGQLLFTVVRDNVATQFETTLPDTDLDRIATAYGALYFSPDGILVPEVPAVLDGDGNEVTPAVPAYYRPVERSDVIIKIADILIDRLKDTTREFEKTVAARQAAEAVPLINTSVVIVANT